MSTSGMSRATDTVEKRNDYEGVYFIGTVIANDSSQATDGKKDARVQIRIANLLSEVPDAMLPWARPAKSMGRGSGPNVQSFSVPVIGAKLMVILQNGDPYHPLYVGGLLTAEDLHEIFQTNYPARYGMADDYGNTFYVDTSTGDVDFNHKSGLNIHVTPAGDFNITGPKDLNANFQGNANVKIVGNTALEVDGNTTATLKGNLNATVTGNAEVDVTGTTTVNSTSDMTLTSASSITITAPEVSIN
jgi:uncharacterized protein involved in type VI secretion and phage assembly